MLTFVFHGTPPDRLCFVGGAVCMTVQFLWCKLTLKLHESSMCCEQTLKSYHLKSDTNNVGQVWTENRLPFLKVRQGTFPKICPIMFHEVTVCFMPTEEAAQNNFHIWCSMLKSKPVKTVSAICSAFYESKIPWLTHLNLLFLWSLQDISLVDALSWMFWQEK